MVVPFFVSTSIPFMTSLTVSISFIFEVSCCIGRLSSSTSLPRMNDCGAIASQYTGWPFLRLACSAAIFDFLSMFFGDCSHELVFKVNHHGSRFENSLGTSFYALSATITLVCVNADEVLSGPVLVAVMNNQVINSTYLFMQIAVPFRRAPLRIGQPLFLQRSWGRILPLREGF